VAGDNLQEPRKRNGNPLDHGLLCIQKNQIWTLITDSLREQLLSVHGIGPETADDILLYVYERPVFVIDAYTRRLFSRLGLLDGELAYEKLRAAFEQTLPPDVEMFNEYHALIDHHAKQVCRPKPLCGACFLQRMCQWKGQSQTANLLTRP